MNVCNLHINIIETIVDVLTVLNANIQDTDSDDWLLVVRPHYFQIII